MKESRPKRRPRRGAGKKPRGRVEPRPAPEGATGVSEEGAGAPARGSRFAWIAPVLLLAVVVTGIWYFVFRDDRSSEVNELMRQANEAMSTHEYGRAELLLRNAIDILPDSGILHHNLAMNYLRQRRLPEARREFLIAASLHGPEGAELRAEEYWQAAQLDVELKRYTHAEELLKRAIAEHPTRTVLHHRLIDLQLVWLKNVSAADSSTARFLQFCGATTENLHDAAFIHQKRGSHATAIVLAQQVIERSDSMIAAHVVLARSHWRTGDLQKGLEALEGPMQRYPQALDLRAVQGGILVGLERPEDAEQTLAYVLERDPEHYEANVSMMMALQAKGDYQAAIDKARYCETLTEDPNELRFLRGQVERFQSAAQGLPPREMNMVQPPPDEANP